jgi:hypothetical protein
LKKEIITLYTCVWMCVYVQSFVHLLASSFISNDVDNFTRTANNTDSSEIYMY